MVQCKKSRRVLLHTIEGIEQRMVFLEDQNTTLIQENNKLKADNMKMDRYVKGLEWDIEAICGYLEKQQDKNKTDD